MKKEHGDGLFRLLAPSVAGLLACVVCLCATSWAWFSASVTAAATTIRSASYTVSVTVQQGESDPKPVIANEEGKFSINLSAGETYTITLAPTPESTAKGYCLIKYNETTYYTGQLVNHEEPLQFTIQASQDESLTITPTWGEYSGDALTLPAELSLPTNDPVVTDQTEIDTGTVEPADESKDEGQEQNPEENSGTEAPETPTEPTTDPATDNTPAEGDSGTGTGDSGDTTPTTPDAAASDTPAPETPAPDPSASAAAPESEN